MEENPPRISSQKRTHEVSGGDPTRKSRHAIDEGGDLIECSSKHCQSCTAGLIADCVALCCCPCALVNLLALAFIKRERDCNLRKRMVAEGILEIASGFGEEEEMPSVAARFGEAERLWLELSQIGHLGFGRVSFTDASYIA
ncbi:hypothetical protein OIU79_026954 [Salix purpurea]|uniref:Uncharacterized protein n=1 Tax=Salix purpurea TaxID=77065 RepID=A0A9Q1A160_SALPP|nr:hypothetical protein OIU79_026954 [Salix purpurea]